VSFRSLYGRIALVFAAILLALGAALSWLGYDAAKRHQHEILQRVSLGLAEHIAKQMEKPDGEVFDPARIDALFRDLMAVNPNIEVYLLGPDGKVLQASHGVAPLERDRVDLGPVHAIEKGGPLPLLGDNPRHADRRDIFSAAPIHGPNGIAGYVYIVLLNDMYRQLVDAAWQGYVLRSTAGIAAIALLAALVIGLLAFAKITRRLLRLTREVESFASRPMDGDAAVLAVPAGRGDEIDRLSGAFASMRDRLEQQMAELKRQDELRRELVANVSHDLRTPLTSMHGYLEALARMGDSLSPADQKQYLDIAVRQSVKVSRLAHQLFELARLEHEETLPQPELFSISDLVQDIAHKYALTVHGKGLQLSTDIDDRPPFVRGDIGMIERVISNLMDNAIRHTPESGEIRLEAHADAEGVEVCVADTGEGISAEHLPGLLEQGSPLRQMAVRRGGGLGLLIAKRILSLHGSRLQAASRLGEGTRISFVLPVVRSA
jgi:signal transduction histidine kinase